MMRAEEAPARGHPGAHPGALLGKTTKRSRLVGVPPDTVQITITLAAAVAMMAS